jgi:hypothetical protein
MGLRRREDGDQGSSLAPSGASELLHKRTKETTALRDAVRRQLVAFFPCLRTRYLGPWQSLVPSIRMVGIDVRDETSFGTSDISTRCKDRVPDT